MIPYGHQLIDNKDIKKAAEALKSEWLTQGPKVGEFEKATARYCGAKYAVAVSSGTAALHAAYAVAGIGPGDEVITTPLTFAATANAAVYCGAKPVFVDIERDTLDINPEFIEGLVTPNTKAIVPVDFAGHPCDYDKIFKIAKKHKILVIEDAAHSLGAEYSSPHQKFGVGIKKKVGSFADMTILSFHPVKAITTGEGGMVLTNNKDFYEKLKVFRHHGIAKKPEKGAWYYEIENPGYNYRLTDFQCALGLSQLKKINNFIKRRREIVSGYNKAFGGIKEIIIPIEKKYVKSAWHIYPIQLRLEKLKAGRREVFEFLQKEGLGVQVHYMPLHLHPFYQRKFGYRAGDFPVAEKYYERALTLPLFPGMTGREVEGVMKAVKKTIYFFKL